MNWPRISVVTPSFNQASFLEQTMRSVLDQGYPNLEYIVMDGGSTDGSIDIIRRYEKQLACWVSQRDSGQSDALAKGFQHSTGSIYAYLNSDDLYLPGALHTVARVFLESKADVVYGDTCWIDTRGEKLGERRQTPFVPAGYLYGGFDLQQPATFWGRSIYEESGGIDPSFSFAFDTELFTRFVLKGARFRHVRKAVASFRIHPASKSSTQFERCESELARLRTKHLRYPFGSVQAVCARNYARAHRTLCYLLQGDLFWLIGRIPDRIRARRSQEIVGPRARSI